MIKTENVNYIYQQGMPSERQALYDVNIEIEDGSLVALIGHTGSGKSTLIQHFNALVKPTSGKIIINGIDVTAPKADLKRFIFSLSEGSYFCFRKQQSKDTRSEVPTKKRNKTISQYQLV